MLISRARYSQAYANNIYFLPFHLFIVLQERNKSWSLTGGVYKKRVRVYKRYTRKQTKQRHEMVGNRIARGENIDRRAKKEKNNIKLKLHKAYRPERVLKRHLTTGPQRAKPDDLVVYAQPQSGSTLGLI